MTWDRAARPLKVVSTAESPPDRAPPRSVARADSYNYTVAMVRMSVLNDALRSIFNAEKRGKRQVMVRPASKVIVKFLQQMMKHGAHHRRATAAPLRSRHVPRATTNYAHLKPELCTHWRCSVLCCGLAPVAPATSSIHRPENAARMCCSGGPVAHRRQQTSVIACSHRPPPPSAAAVEHCVAAAARSASPRPHREQL